MNIRPSTDLRRLLTEAEDTGPAARIVRLLAGNGALTAAELSVRAGFARSTVSMTLAELRRMDVVLEQETAPSGMGRPQVLHSLNPQAGVCAGIHFAIEEIRIILADVAHEILARTSVPLPRDYSPEQARDALGPAILQICADLGLTPDALLGAGLAVSSPVAPDGQVRRSSVLPTWSAVHLSDYFAPILPCPIYAENESNCAALAEMMWGAAQGELDFILYKLDLGIGGAVVQNGQVWRGMHGSAGEFGFVSRGPLLGIDQAAAGATVGGSVGGLSLLARANRPGLTLEGLVAEALAGDAALMALVEELGLIAGWGLSIASTILDPPLFVVSGPLAALGEVILAPLRAAHARHALPRPMDLAPGDQVRFVTGHFLETDNLLGAAALVLRQHGRITA